MRKPRDFDSELQALTDKAKLLKERKLHQLGELVVTTGADALSIEHLAGVLLVALDITDGATKEGWRKRGAAFFQRADRPTPRSHDREPRSAASDDGGASETGG